MSARGDNPETVSELAVEMRLGFQGVHDKLDGVKEVINDLKKANVRAWKQIHNQGTRTTKVETRLENCGELSGSGRNCPTTTKLDKVCRQQEKQKDRGMMMYGILIALTLGAAGLIADIALRLMG